MEDAEYNRTWNEESHYSPLRTLRDHRFGGISLLKHNTTGEQIFYHERIVNKKAEATAELLGLKQRMRLNHPNLL